MTSMLSSRMAQWPDNKRFAFTVFDDPDSQSLEAGEAVYGFLADCGLRTTKGVWPVRGPLKASDNGITCADDGCVPWLHSLQRAGFEIGFHNATSHTSTREETVCGLERFAELFGNNPRAMAHHYHCNENLYWGEHRLTGVHRAFYNLLTRFQHHNRYFGHCEGHPYFWGDVCREKITYVRNFVFPGINTLRECPFMPYHDPRRPYVNFWYASSEGANVRSMNDRITEAAQDRLEEEGGACVMYTHFGHGYHEGGAVNARFRELILRISRKNGWFVPVSTLLDYLRSGSTTCISDAQRRTLERRWLAHKIRFGTA